MWILDGTWGMHDGGMGWWIFGGIWMIVFWGLIIGLIVWGVSRVTGERRGDEGSQRDVGTIRGEQSPMDIARSRYARGEISREEFTQIRNDLEAV
jgi:putative membrane protein